jgi:TRAP-type C4-dicarboxylate transport system substrate-binding protein
VASPIQTTLALLFAGSLFSGTAAAETFKYGSFVPERSSANTKGVFPLMEKLDKATEGRMKFEKIVGGTVLTAPNSLRGIRDRIVDAGFIVSQFHIPDLPYASLMGELSGFGTDTFAVLGALNEAYFMVCKQCQEDFKKHGLVPLFIQSATPQRMNCAKPAATAVDLKGLRQSATSTPDMRWGQAIGMTPRRQTFAEFVQSLQLGQSDCFSGPIAWIKSYGLADTIKSVNEMPQGVITGAVPILFNAAAWAKVSEADKKAIVRNMPRWIYEYTDAAYEQEDAVIKQELQGKGVSFHPGDAALKEAFQKYQAAEAEALIKLAESRNLAGGRALIENIVAVFKKWHTVHLPKFAGKPDVFADILMQEVFSKVSY